MRQILFRIPLDETKTFLIAAVIIVTFVTVQLFVPGLKGRSKQNKWGLVLMGGGALALVKFLLPVLHRFAGDGFPVYGYGSMLFVGFLTAAVTGARRAQRDGLDSNIVWDVATWMFIAGIVGARVLYVIQKPENVFRTAATPWEKAVAAVNLPEGGLVLYGGVLLALAVFFVFCWGRRIDVLRLADILIPSFFLALAFGRVGCFLNGCCYGDVCSLPWGVHFPDGSVPLVALENRGIVSADASIRLALHPTQLYSAFNALVLAAVTAGYFRRRKRDGDVLAMALLIYPITRFSIEFLRSDEFGWAGTMFTISQWISFGLFTAGVLLTAFQWRRDSHGVVASARLA